MSVPSRQLTPEDLELIEFARQIVDANADGEDGVHTMGAAVRGADGTMYGGINVYHFTGGPCAELVALGHGRASGARELSAIVAVGNFGRGPMGPCGRDRQVLFDYHPRIRVILPTPEGVRSVRITDLMPLGAVWSATEGTQPFDPALFDRPVVIADSAVTTYCECAACWPSGTSRRPPRRAPPGRHAGQPSTPDTADYRPGPAAAALPHRRPRRSSPRTPAPRSPRS